VSLPLHWRRFALAELPAEPWANGGGLTRTLMTGPGDAEERRLWRISVADIPADAEFSQWAGWRRQSLLLEGGPIELAADDGERLSFEALGAALAYDGGRRWAAHLKGPAARFFNVMNQVDAEQLTIHLLHGRRALQAADRLLLVLRGHLEIAGEAGARQTLHVAEGEGLRSPVGQPAMSSPAIEVSPDFLAVLVRSNFLHTYP
jgi:environmental stress-induced protein Ves